MTDTERALFTQIMQAHALALDELKIASAAMTRTLTTLQEVNTAHGHALDHLVEANKTMLVLLER